MAFTLGARRGVYLRVAAALDQGELPLSVTDLGHFEALDLAYRSLCALMYNYAPTSGHPGGSVSSGRIVEGILFDALDYDLQNPDREDADLVCYAAGHKALGLYAIWALRDEIARLGAPSLLPADARQRLRLEDLLGFRRNPINRTPLFVQFQSKALDGHPTPAAPFVRLSTGASGVGLASSIGLALGARDYYGAEAPRVHIVEGEGGLTPGRCAEALAAAATASLDNVFLHVDWNQASIDSERVCPEDGQPGDYVQWNPVELLYLHDWNVVFAPNGLDLQQVIQAQRAAASLRNGQPTAIVYRTRKGWRYGIEGRASHGAGHKQCSEGFYRALSDLVGHVNVALPVCDAANQRCAPAAGGTGVMEECFWEALGIVRKFVGGNAAMVEALSLRLSAARERLDQSHREPRPGAPRVDTVYEIARESARNAPVELRLEPGVVTTLRAELARALQYYSKGSGGALFTAAADLLGSTSINAVAAGFPGGFWNSRANPEARTLSVGGICEDAMSGILSGISTFGRHIGVGASYGAFLAPLGHIAARLHAIGAQARHSTAGDPYRPIILVCAHAGLKTGEDGPTHADPQSLQLLQGNFPPGTCVTLTPWEPAEIWPLLAAALARRPALIAPFVTRPNERVPDRAALGLAPARAAAAGVYLLRKPLGAGEGTVVLQESAVTIAFVERALPLLEQAGIDLWVYCVSSADLFDLMAEEDQRSVFPEERAREAMGITGFTVPTMFRWIRSDLGRSATLHPYRKDHFLGSGPGEIVLEEAGLDGETQFKAIKEYVGKRRR
jgi:transketolase